MKVSHPMMDADMPGAQAGHVRDTECSFQGYAPTMMFALSADSSVVSAHVTDVTGADGPFAQLGALAIGDSIYIHAPDQVYIYQVQAQKEVAPGDLSIFNEVEGSQQQVLTLVTCSAPNHTTHTYDARLVVQAVLVH